VEFEATLAATPAGATLSVPPEIGRYKVVGELGRGAMGVVLLAHDPVLDREVAVKLLLGSEDTQRTLLREAQTMARVAHPNIVTVHDVGQVDGRTFVAMERVVGDTLREWLQLRPRHAAEILDVYEQAGEGLAAAHRSGLVHCDFKPDNALIGHDGRVRVADFGLAMPSPGARGTPEDGRGPNSGIAGTPAYMSPEQAEGVRVDARSDQFSFCVALFEALHGSAPFGGTTFSERQRAIQLQQLTTIAPIGGLPDGVNEAVRRGLSRAADHRFPTMDALLLALRTARRRGGVGLPPEERVAAVWTAGARAAIAGRFVDAGLPFVERTFVDVAARLERHLAAWCDAATDAQRAAAEDPYWYADAVAHSERALQEIATYVGVLEHVDPVQFAGAYRGDLPLRALGEYGLAEEAPVASPRPPRDPARRRAAEHVRGQAIRASMLSLLRRPEALALAEDAVALAEQLGDRVSLAEALVTAGAARIMSGTGADAGVALLERALVVAAEAGHTQATALASIELARAFVGLGAGVPTAMTDLERAGALLASARNGLRLLGNPARPEADLAAVESAWRLRRSDYAEALTTASQALDRLAVACGPTAPERVPLLIRRALIHAEAGNAASAVADAQLAVDSLDQALGSGHPGAAQALDFQGHFLMVALRMDEAHAIYDRLAALLDHTPHADAVRRAWCDHKRGEIALRTGRVHASIHFFEAALARLRARGPLHFVAFAGPMDCLAVAAWLAGDVARARTLASEAWAGTQAMSPAPQLARFVRAIVMAHDGDVVGAHAALDALETVRERMPGAWRGFTAAADVWRGRVFALQGRQRDALVCFDRAVAHVTPGCERERLELLADRALAHHALTDDLAGLDDVLQEAQRLALVDLPYLGAVRARLRSVRGAVPGEHVRSQ
jgi:tetratricopeptide (TPR) repeat protein